jgi:hypothetical protein
MEEPIIIKQFDGSDITANIEFENRLFPMINELSYILNNFKNKTMNDITQDFGMLYHPKSALVFYRPKERQRCVCRAF